MDPSLLAAVLTVGSVMSLSLFLLLCLRSRRRRKPKIIHEETQIYNPQVFIRGGSKFAVVRSKTVTGANQMSPTTPEEPAEEPAYKYAGQTKKEHTYIDPISINDYENEENILERDAGVNDGLYGNMPPKIQDDSDYENSEFLAKQQEDENDYVNLEV